jgi:transcriptional regulator with XRE-family HTH domain
MKRSAAPHLLSMQATDVLDRLGQRISLARRARRMTQPDLAAQVGVGLSTLRQIERGAPTVQIGYYMAALWYLDLLGELHASVERLGRESATVVLLEQDAMGNGSRSTR